MKVPSGTPVIKATVSPVTIIARILDFLSSGVIALTAKVAMTKNTPCCVPVINAQIFWLKKIMKFARVKIPRLIKSCVCL